MLASLDRAVVISEAPPADQVLQARIFSPETPREEQVRALRHLVHALGQPRTGKESLYFLKLDSWHTHQLPLIREAFPGVAWIFLHRDIGEVVESHMQRPGILCAPGAMDPRVILRRAEDVTALSRKQWSERVVGGLLESASVFRSDPAGLFVDHTELPAAAWGKIASHFGVRFTEHEQALMLNAADLDL